MTPNKKSTIDNPVNHPIAIIGMGCIFPESRNLKEYWHLLFNGIDAITPIPEDSHWQLKDYYDSDPACPDHTYCTQGGFIPKIAFDPLKYGMPPKNIQATDTSQLLGLEVARMALADAGYPMGHEVLSTRKVNVILGVTGTQELVIPLGARLGHPLWKKAMEDEGLEPKKTEEILQRLDRSYVQWQENSFPGLLGNVVAGRIANRLDLSGTNAVSDAACASSLSAIHTAVMELQTGRCDMSITGGVDTLNDIFMHMCFSKTGVLSHTSDAKPFSKDADGTVLGEGIGMLVLKRLSDAERDKDRIYAVIKGIGTSSDGKTSAVYAPEAKGQIRALKEAYNRAGVSPSSVELIEAHGTGTRVGDKVEFTALKEYFGNSSGPQSTAIGSVKSMIGHAKAAAGAAGMIKTALALHHKVLPPTLKAGEPDPELDINASAFYLNDRTKPWIPGTKASRLRCSGVSAFGFGGSNFHAVLEEYQPEKKHVSWDGSVQIIALSAQSRQDLADKLRDTGNQVGAHDPEDRAEYTQAIAWQAFESRKTFSSKDKFRVLILAAKGDDFSDLVKKGLEIIQGDPIAKPPVFFGMDTPKGKLGFVFPGQGSQYTGMVKDIISMFPEAMDALMLGRSCTAAGDTKTGTPPLNEFIFPLPAHVLDKKLAEESLRQTDIAQPAIGSTCLAMTEILKRFGIAPDMACGHSFGELSALHAAGWMDAKDFLELAGTRGRHMAAAGKAGNDPGGMLAIQAPIDKIQNLIDQEKLDLVLANKNSHTQGVLSGSTKEIDRAYKLSRKQKMRAVKLPVAAAFHSRLVENAAIPFTAEVAEKKLTPTEIEVLSNTTGKCYPKTEKKAKALLGNQLMHPVNFIDNIEFMREKGVATFLEVGPKSVLTGLINSILKGQDIQTCAMDASAGKKPGVYDLGTALCLIGSLGYSIDLSPWEEAADKPVPRKMKLMLSGANPKPVGESLPPRTTQPEPASPLVAQPSKDHTKTNSENRREDKPNSNPQGRIMTPTPQSYTQIVNPQPGPARGNIDILQKGLEAMQQLQAQTARAHEKFLETQAQAGQTLAVMMEQTRSTGQVSPPVYQAPAPVAPRVETVKAPAEIREIAVPEPTQPVVPPVEAMTNPEPKPDTIADRGDHPDIRAILFDTVSKLTGFPVEMLEPDMDIESDLGIDSIKKVEIISELEKQMADKEGVSPDHLATVRTLDDICRAMGGSSRDSQPDAGSQIQETVTSDQDSVRIFNVLVNIISELTGFPKEMLEPDMNLESDLGIDSIKRVEILSKLEQELPDITAISPDEMGVLKTIQDIVQYLSPDRQQQDASKGSSQTSKKKTSLDALSPENRHQEKLGQDPEKTEGELLRQEIVLTEYPVNQIRFYNGTRIQIPSGRVVYLTRDGSGIAQKYQDEFTALGIQADLIDIGAGPAPDLPDAAGIVIIPDAFASPDDETAKSFLLSAFDLARKNAGHLISSANEKGGFLTCLSFSGGGFGFDQTDYGTSPVYGGLAGLAKTAGLEWTAVLCRALDMPADPEAAKENAEAIAALMMTHGAVEMGIKGDQCAIPTLVDRPSKQDADGPGLTPEDVVVITGGAKGVTAECALALARDCGPRIVLLGRSPAPFQEPDWVRSLTDPGQMKKAILANAFEGKKPKPADVEKHYRAICSNRSIQSNIDRIKALADQVHYHSVDIRDKKEVAEIFSRIETSLGSVTAVIHGAGVLEDKLIAEKTPEQFKRVFDTKVEGLEAILGAVDNQKLRHLVLFSSIAGRLGNPGQCDYAMANEVLNKMAQARSVSHPHCRVVSINWGPWDGGMVNDALKREFSKRGVDLIPLSQGAGQLVTEMGNPNHSCVEVVIGGTMNPPAPTKKPILNIALTQTLGPKASPIINDHRIDNKPVVPFALMADLMASGTEKNNPGLIFAGIDQMRLLKGITPGREERDVQVNVGRCVLKNGNFSAPATLSTPAENNTIHANADVLLAETLPEPPVLSKAAFMDLKPCGLSPDRAYEEILFHQGGLQSIIKITGVSPKGIEVISRPAPSPTAWYKTPHAKDWTIDPLMLDAAFQAAILWTHETRNQVCLPSFFANLSLYRSYPVKTGNIRILFTVNNETRHKVQGYFTFLDETDTVIASIMGFEAFIDPGLMDKFKTKPLFDRDKILAFAQGNPSDAFGAPYKIFDKDRQIARLPRPPYFFMDSVITADHPQWDMAPGGWIEATYEIPESEWYFAANRTSTLPFCILLEVALQPCGWLAAYAGSALKSDDRLHFRNLGGNAELIENLVQTSGPVTIRAKMTEVSQAGGMIIQDFKLEVLNRDRMVYRGTTNFGFFTKEALSNQVGIRNSRLYTQLPSIENKGFQVSSFQNDAPITPDDPARSPDLGMPSKALRMIDEIDYLDFDGGLYKNGCIQAVKRVVAEEWFFDAHFYQDPVCPGSLGVESFLQMLRFFLIKKYEIDTIKYEPIMTQNCNHKWIYRGQIIPSNDTVLIQAHIKESSDENGNYTIVADGSLVVDGICIYEMEDFSVQFVPSIVKEAEERIAVHSGVLPKHNH